MATIKQRLLKLESSWSHDATTKKVAFKLLPIVVDEHVTDEEIAQLRRLSGRVVYRSGDPALYDEFV